RDQGRHDAGRHDVGRHDDLPPEPSEPSEPLEPPGHEVVDVPAGLHRPNPKDRSLSVEREALQLALQHPDLVVDGYPQVRAEAYTDATYAILHEAIMAAGGPPGDGAKTAWVETVAGHLPAGPLRSLVTELAVEPPPIRPDAVNAGYAGAILARMAERVAAADERTLRSALQRAESAGEQERVLALHADLVAVANYRRALGDRARGEA
ncbi:MAG TPA: hypothetical protein VII33_20075, partial [Nakamurella sp.]